MKLRACLALAVIAAPLLATPTVARAADTGSSSDNRAVAEMLFFTGRGLMEAGRYSEACNKLGESYRLDPAAGTLLNLAVCHEKEGKLASAWGEYRQALFDARKQNRADREELAKDHIAVLEPQLPFLTINVPDAVKVKDLEIVRNGNPLQSGGWGTELPTDPGKVEIVARAPGYLPKTKVITIEKTQHMSVTIEKLELAPIVETGPVAERGWSTKRKIGAYTFVGGLVVTGVGAYLGVSALNAQSKSDAACPTRDGEVRCTAQGADYASQANGLAWGSNIAIGVGVAALATGTFLFITGKNDDATEAAPPPGTEATAKKDEKQAKRESSPWTWSVAPTVGGAAGFVARTF